MSVKSTQYIIVGLGNPGDEYNTTRHNTGRIFLEKFKKQKDFPDWSEYKKNKLLISDGKLCKKNIVLLEPNNFMNNSGKSIVSFITNKTKAHNLVVIYDDIDLPIGKFKLSFNRGSGGHKGIESIARSIKTKEFIRVRIGISPVTSAGKIRKPKGEDKVHKFILGKFSADETKKIKILSKKINLVLEKIISEGYERAVSSL